MCYNKIMQFEVTPETEVITACPNCQALLSLHILDDRVVCPDCYFAYGRDEKSGQLEFAFESFPGDAVGEKYLRELAGGPG